MFVSTNKQILYCQASLEFLSLYVFLFVFSYILLRLSIKLISTDMIIWMNGRYVGAGVHIICTYINTIYPL